jgi:hypothetical protein
MIIISPFRIKDVHEKEKVFKGTEVETNRFVALQIPCCLGNGSLHFLTRCDIHGLLFLEDEEHHMAIACHHEPQAHD